MELSLDDHEDKVAYCRDVLDDTEPRDFLLCSLYINIAWCCMYAIIYVCEDLFVRWLIKLRGADYVIRHHKPIPKFNLVSRARVPSPLPPLFVVVAVVPGRLLSHPIYSSP